MLTRICTFKGYDFYAGTHSESGKTFYNVVPMGAAQPSGGYDSAAWICKIKNVPNLFEEERQQAPRWGTMLNSRDHQRRARVLNVSEGARAVVRYYWDEVLNRYRLQDMPTEHPTTGEAIAAALDWVNYGSNKSAACKMVLRLMDQDHEYKDALLYALTEHPTINRAELENELNKYV